MPRDLLQEELRKSRRLTKHLQAQMTQMEAQMTQLEDSQGGKLVGQLLKDLAKVSLLSVISCRMFERRERDPFEAQGSGLRFTLFETASGPRTVQPHAIASAPSHCVAHWTAAPRDRHV